MPNFPGGRTPAAAQSFWLDAGDLYSYFTAPQGRMMLNGQRRVLVTDVALFVAGYSGARQCRFFIDDTYSTQFTVASGSAAVEYTRQMSALLTSGETYRYGREFNGAGYYGRSTSGGLVYYGSTTRAGQLSGAYDYAEAPSQPRNVTATGISPTEVLVEWDAPSSDGGAPIDGYTVQLATNTAFTTGLVSVNVNAAARDRTIAGLSTGADYYVRVLARNAVTAAAGSYSPASATVPASPVLPAPGAFTVTREGATGIRADWAPPSPSTGLTGYRVQLATNAAFTAGLITRDLADDVFTTLFDRPTGVRYYLRAAALTATGQGAYTATREIYVPAESGNLDGWTHDGTIPPAVYGLVPELVRRGLVAGAPALYREVAATGPATLTAPWGITREFEVEENKVYQFTVDGHIAAAAQITSYALSIDGILDAPFTLGALPAEFPPLTFIATTPTVTLGIHAATPGPITAGTVEEAVFSRIRLVELASDSIYRLRSTVYESSLANHLDLACNSVGAAWLVDADGVTRFVLPNTATPTVATFSDRRGPDKLEYLEPRVAFDTRTLVNRLTGSNRGIGEDDLDYSPAFTATNTSSASRFGTRTADIDLNLYDDDVYAGTLAIRLDQLLERHSEPSLLITGFRWNAQEDLALVPRLEIGARVTVEFNGWRQDSRINNLTHMISGTRWIVEVSLIPLSITHPEEAPGV